MLPHFTILSAGERGNKKPYRMTLTPDNEYHVQLEGEPQAFNIKREGNGKWTQSSGEPLPAAIIDELGENLNDIDKQEFEFALVDDGKQVTCKVAMGESGFGVLFDNRLVAEVNLNEDGITWEATSGELDPEVAQEIGKRIEDHYE